MRGFYILLLLFYFCGVSFVCDAGNSHPVYRQVGFRSDTCVNNQWYYSDSSQQSDYSYDSIFGKLKKQYVRKWNGSEWVPNYYTASTIDDSGNVITLTQYNWDSLAGDYVKNNLMIKIYNKANFNTSDTSFLWDVNSQKWIYSTLTISSFDTVSGQTTQSSWDTLNQNWSRINYQSWIINHKMSYTTAYETWVNGILNEGTLTGFVFDTSGNELQVAYQYWDNQRQNWFNNFINDYTYDSKNNNTLELTQTWDTLFNEYYTSRYDTSIYDSNSNLVDEYINRYSFMYSVTHDRLVYINDSSGNNIIRTQYRLDSLSQTWINIQKYSRTYDNKHQTLSDTAEWWNNGQWQYINFIKYEYGINNRPTLQEFYEWRSSWTLLERFDYEYDNFSNKVYSLFQFNYGGDTLNLTGSRYYYYYEALDISNNISNPPSQLTIYPDPASQILNIALPETYLNEAYTVCDMAGRKMAAGSLSGNNYAINVSAYAEGIYTLRVNNVSQKFVVKR